MLANTTLSTAHVQTSSIGVASNCERNPLRRLTCRAFRLEAALKKGYKAHSSATTLCLLSAKPWIWLISKICMLLGTCKSHRNRLEDIVYSHILHRRWFNTVPTHFYYPHYWILNHLYTLSIIEITIKSRIALEINHPALIYLDIRSLYLHHLNINTSSLFPYTAYAMLQGHLIS